MGSRRGAARDSIVLLSFLTTSKAIYSTFLSFVHRFPEEGAFVVGPRHDGGGPGVKNGNF